jgi:hypothetical protein
MYMLRFDIGRCVFLLFYVLMKHIIRANVKKNLGYILRVIVMLFLRAKVIPVNPQIHGNVMCPLFVLSFIFEPLFVHAPDIFCILQHD